MRGPKDKGLTELLSCGRETSCVGGDRYTVLGSQVTIETEVAER